MVERQVLRLFADTCMVNKRMATLIDDCRDDYNWVDDDTKDYSPGLITYLSHLQRVSE